jgi:hypothetical protein
MLSAGASVGASDGGPNIGVGLDCPTTCETTKNAAALVRQQSIRRMAAVLSVRHNRADSFSDCLREAQPLSRRAFEARSASKGFVPKKPMLALRAPIKGL